jgi:long-chain acyl-CoA synthetase
VKVKIAEDGEILIRSRKVMREYLADPAGTKSALQDGWFHTGDVGELDAQGHLKITDRKKDLLKTAGAKYIAPQRLEGFLKLSPFISNVHIHGDNRKFCVALITLASETIENWAKESGVAFESLLELSQNPKVKELLRKAVAEANANLAPFETVKNFAILDHDFTVENGELTPSLKVKRKVIEERYKAIFDSMY